MAISLGTRETGWAQDPGEVRLCSGKNHMTQVREVKEPGSRRSWGSWGQRAAGETNVTVEAVPASIQPESPRHGPDRCQGQAGFRKARQ